MKTKVSASIIGVLVILCLVFMVSAVDATTVKIDPATQTLKPGDAFSVNVTVENVTYMAADQATLNFDPSAMQATVIVEGDFLKSAGTTLGAGMEVIDNVNGSVTFFYALMTPGVGVNGSGTLATIYFNTNVSAECTFPLNLTEVALADGDGNPITVYAIYNGEVKLDNTPPIVEIISPQNCSWFDSEDIVVIFHPWDEKAELLNYTVFLDGVEVANGTAVSCNNTTVNLGMLSECDHMIRVNVTDDVGLEGSAEVTIHVDLTPPTVEIISPQNGSWFDSEPFNITFHTWDNKAEFLNYSVFDDGIEVANGTAENCTITNVTLNPVELGECNHTIRVNVTDYAGKTNSSGVTIHVDLTPPTVEILSPQNCTWFGSEDLLVTFHPWDNKADMLDYWVYVDGVEKASGTAANCSNEVVNVGTILSECDHVIMVKVKDYAGKTNSSEVTIHVDLTPPTVEILSPQNGTWFDSEPVNVTFHPWDNQAELLNYTVFVDDVEVANGTAVGCNNIMVNLGILSECDHVIRVNVTDDVGLEGSAEVTIHVDLTPPTVEIISPQNGTWFDSEPVNVTFHPWDNKADMLYYWVYVDDVEKANGTAANCSEEVVNVGTILSECDHVITVVVKDHVGKMGFSEVTIHVDLTPPTVEIRSPEAGMLYRTACVRLNFTAEDTGVCPSGIDEIYYVLDGGDPVTISGNATISDVGPCDHTVVVYVKDKAGKLNSSEVSFTAHPGDITGDGKVNILDLQRLAWAFDSQPGSPNWNPDADLTCDDKVNIFDLQRLAWNFGNDYTVMCGPAA